MSLPFSSLKGSEGRVFSAGAVRLETRARSVRPWLTSSSCFVRATAKHGGKQRQRTGAGGRSHRSVSRATNFPVNMIRRVSQKKKDGKFPRKKGERGVPNRKTGSKIKLCKA